MKKGLLAVVLLLSFASSLEAQIVRAFKPRFQVTQKGGIVYLANTSVSCNANPNTAGGSCQTATSETALTGSLGVNNSYNGKYVDIDGDASTFMSSSDKLNLPNCSNITWAGLYWSGMGNNTVANRNKAKIKVNNGAYQQITADTSYLNTVGYNSYHSFKDITSIVQAAGTQAKFTIADIPFINNNATNNWGGWMIAVVYGNQLEGMKQLTVFDGLASISSGITLNVPITGFLTPPTGPVNFEIGNFVLDGDRGNGYTGDNMQFNGAGSFVGISDALNPSNDVMNSTVSYKGVLTPNRIPNLNNTLGLDADIFQPNNATKNYIGNAATSATLRYTTGGETYLVQEVSTAIDVYEPDLRVEKRVTDSAGNNLYGVTVNPGSTLVYTIKVSNIGSDASLNTFITDSLSKNANYVPGSLRIIHGPGVGNISDAAGDDRGEYTGSNQKIRVRVGTGGNSSTGGRVVNSPAGTDSTVITFRAIVTNDCFYLACSNVVSNRASATGTGEISGNTNTVGSNPNGVDGGGCPISGSTYTFVNVAALPCTIEPDVTIANICPTTQTFAALYTRPGYTTFVNSTFDTVTTAADPGTYYAFKTSYAGCTDTVRITVTATDCSVGVGSGGGAGVESYSLGNIIAKRTFDQTHQGGLADPNYATMRSWNPREERRILSNSTSTSGTLRLADLVPTSFSNTKLVPFITTPVDLLKFTNAKEILAVDYVETQIPRAVSFATRTNREVYNHTKPICDRLKGAQLLKVSPTTIDGIELLTYTIRNADRKTEYAVSFTAGQSAGKTNMRIQSNWFSRDILNDDNMYNFQLWAESPELLKEMIEKVFANIKKSAKIEGVNIISMPDAYIKSGKREGGDLILTIVNNTNQTTGYFDYAGNNNEQPSAVNKKIPFNMQANGETTITIPVGDALEANISMFVGSANSLEDLVYLADGTWGVDYIQNNTRIGKFNVYNDPNRKFNNEFPLFRNVELNAVTNDFVTVYKSLSGGGADKNLTAFNAIKFTGAANSAIRIVLVKKSFNDWTEQYNYILPINSNEKEYIIPFSAFTSSVHKTAIKPTDIVQIVFTYEAGRPNTSLNASIKNASFIKAEFPEAEDPTMKIVSAYPNPANGMFKVSFKSTIEMPLTMRITDISTGKPIFSKSFTTIKGENLVDVDLTNRLINKQVGIITLEGSGSNYLPTKIVIGLD